MANKLNKAIATCYAPVAAACHTLNSNKQQLASVQATHTDDAYQQQQSAAEG